ncbi:hypothetical protein BJY01DRAFT_112275 [Aspergillus pseudoustus]|uniref:Uncharacterized protein n=1 Tax=Aspergillus pseudoustus TaxID=1810923 RepID=A0ABR4KZM4_9EURO
MPDFRVHQARAWGMFNSNDNPKPQCLFLPCLMLTPLLISLLRLLSKGELCIYVSLFLVAALSYALLYKVLFAPVLALADSGFYTPFFFVSQIGSMVMLPSMFPTVDR